MVADDVEIYVRWTCHARGHPVGPFSEVREVRAYMADHGLPPPDVVVVPHHRSTQAVV